MTSSTLVKPAASSVFLALADRLEKEAPGNDLDIGIYCALHSYVIKHKETALQHGLLVPAEADGGWPVLAFCVPKFTTSLDAAVTLQPEGYRWRVVNEQTDTRWYAELHDGKNDLHESRADTEAMARVAASLRAMAATRKGEVSPDEDDRMSPRLTGGGKCA